MMIKCQLIGAITGTFDYQERFAEAEQEVIERRMIVINPVTLPHNHNKKWTAYMRECIRSMMDVEAVYVLKGWKKSKGARLEVSIAKQLNIEIIYQPKK